MFQAQFDRFNNSCEQQQLSDKVITIFEDKSAKSSLDNDDFCWIEDSEKKMTVIPHKEMNLLYDIKIADFDPENITLPSVEQPTTVNVYILNYSVNNQQIIKKSKFHFLGYLVYGVTLGLQLVSLTLRASSCATNLTTITLTHTSSVVDDLSNILSHFSSFLLHSL